MSAGSVRAALPGDRGDVLAMWRSLLHFHGELHPSYRVELQAGLSGRLSAALDRELRDVDASVWIAPPDLGFCIARRIRPPVPHAADARGSLDELFVRPDQRRQGLGRELVRCAFDALRAQGVKRVEVRVLHANDDARAFWRGIGFAPFVDLLERSVDEL